MPYDPISEYFQKYLKIKIKIKNIYLAFTYCNILRLPSHLSLNYVLTLEETVFFLLWGKSKEIIIN